ncbi:unnamed protein product [Rhodiola kirilowii]
MEVGEVDTRPQFKSVEDAISLFSIGPFIENQSIIKRSRPYLPERVVSKEPEQHLVQKELYKFGRKIYFEFEEERKLVEDMNSKLLNLHASGELSSAGNETPCLIEVVTEEKSSFNNVLESLKLELKSLKKERSKLTAEELLTESTCSSLKTQKLEMNACLAEELAARGQFDGLVSALREMLLETRNARKEEDDEMKVKTKELKKHAEAASRSLKLLENELRLALEETEEANLSEARILDQIKILSEKAIPETNYSKSDSITGIMIPEEEFEYLIQRIHETDTITEMKVAAAREQIEAAKAIEHKSLKKLKRRKKQIEDMRAILDLACKRAQVAEASKKELRKQHKREQNKSGPRTPSRTETQKYAHLTMTSKHNIAPQIKINEQYTAAGGGCLP